MSTKKNILDQIVDNVKKTVDKDEDNSAMGKLLEISPVEFPEIGDVLEGTVIDVSPFSVLLDIGNLGTGIVMGKNTKDGLRNNKKLKVGDKVTATLMDFENEDGYIELSIREASYDKAWEDLESKRDNEDVVEVRVLDANKGGLMVEVNGIGGFLPVSQLSGEHYPRVEDGNKNKILEKLKKLVGQTLTVKVIDTYRDEEKLIVSEKAAMSEKEEAMISKLKEGDVIEGEISGVVDFGAFVKFLPPSIPKEEAQESDKLEGLVHISELAWQLISDPKEIVKVGDTIKAKIIGIDDSRISLSMRALEKDPWENIKEKYQEGKTYPGTVDRINHFGAFVYLDDNIHGLAHVSEFSEMYPGKKMDDMIEAGKEYEWKVLSIEPKDHRMGLVLMDKGKKEDVAGKKETKKPKKVKKEASIEVSIEASKSEKKKEKKKTEKKDSDKTKKEEKKAGKKETAKEDKKKKRSADAKTKAGKSKK